MSRARDGRAAGGPATAGARPQEIAERAIAAARTDECIVIVDEAESAHLRWASNAVIAAGRVRDHRVTVVAVVEGPGGTTAGVTARHGGPHEDITGLVRTAESAAWRAPASEDAAPLPAGDRTSPDWDEPPGALPPGGLDEFAARLREAAGRAHRDGRRLYGYAENEVRSTYLATSTGLRLRHVQPSGLVDLTARDAVHGATAWSGSSLAVDDPRDPPEADLAAMDLRLRTRLGWAGRRMRLPPGRYEVLLSPSCVADLMLHLYEAAGAGDALDGRSPFAASDGRPRIGERLTPVPLTLGSDPRMPGLECAPVVIARSSSQVSSVFDNGLPLGRTNWVEDGRLAALVQTRRTAAASGLPATPWIDNLRLEGGSGTRSLTEMVAGTRRGLLITSLWYLRSVEPSSLLLTGLTRDGVYAIDQGEITGAVNDFRFNESPLAVLERVTEVGRTVRTLPREWGDRVSLTAMPPLRVADFHLSSVGSTSS